jgi:hypothetical protein
MFLRGKEEESVSVSRVIQMQNGQYFCLSINPASDCYCYIVLYDSEKQIIVLYDKVVKAEDPVKTKQVNINGPSGTERVYVIMSLKPQQKLEGFIKAQRDNPSSTQAINNLYREITSLQDVASKVGEPSSTFIRIGGTTRSAVQYVNRFWDKDLYVRTITISH